MIARIKLLLPIFFLLAIMAQPAMAAQKLALPSRKPLKTTGSPWFWTWSWAIRKILKWEFWALPSKLYFTGQQGAA